MTSLLPGRRDDPARRGHLDRPVETGPAVGDPAPAGSTSTPTAAGHPAEGTRVHAGDGRAAVVVLLAAAVGGAGAILVARTLIGAGYQPSPIGLPDAGAVTADALPLVRLVQEMAGIAVVGVLLVRLLLGAGVWPGRGALVHRLGSATVAWAGVWVVASVATWVLALSDLAGVPVTGLPARADVIPLLFGTDRMLSITATLWVAVLLWLFGRRFDGRVGLSVLLTMAVIGLLPLALTGHVAHHNADIALATMALGVHVAAAALWVGGLLVIVVHLRRHPVALAVAVPSFSALALGCVAAVGLSGVVASVAMLDGWAELFSTDRGTITLAKAGALAALIAVGAWHRRRTVAQVRAGRAGPLLRAGAVELALMAAAVGLAVVLSGTA